MIIITIGYCMVSAELYRVFYQVGLCGNISLAAARLFVSQPAVSKSIKKLEELTGCTLFYRSSKGVTLTTEGRILFEYVARGFEALDSGEKMLEKIQNREAGVVRIGISSTLCRHVLLPHLALFHRYFPGIKVTIVNRSSIETLTLLRQGSIDVGIVSLPEEENGLQCLPLLTITDIFVAGKTHAGFFTAPVPLKALLQYPLMMLEEGNATRTYVESFARENGVLLRAENEISSMDFLVEFARIGIGIAPVIEEFVNEDLRCGVLKKIALRENIPARKVGLVYPQGIPLSTAAKTFMDSLQQGLLS